MRVESRRLTSNGQWYRLVVMTFNVYFCVAVVLGIGFGELLFGRHGRR